MADKAKPAVSLPDFGEIERTSLKFQTLAAAVSLHLRAFEEWLSKLPAKTEVFAASEDAQSKKYHMLRLTRASGEWVLEFSHAEEDGFKPLSKASLVNRCIAVTLLPELLENLYADQRAGLSALESAFDILSSLPNVKGGK